MKLNQFSKSVRDEIHPRYDTVFTRKDLKDTRYKTFTEV